MILDSVYPALGGGGAEAQVGTLSRWFSRHGAPCVIVTPMVPWGPQRSSEQDDMIEIVRIRYPRVPLLGGLILQLRLAALLMQRRHEIRALHCHIANNMAATTALANRWLKKNMLVKLTGSTELNGGILAERPSLAMRLKRMLLKPSMIQAISQTLVARLPQAGFDASRVFQVPNAVDTERFYRSREARQKARETRYPADELVMVYIGRLEAEKGVDLLLDAWADAFRPDQPVRLVLVGTGSMQTQLEALAEVRGCAHQLEFVGHSNDVAQHLAAADIGVLTSYAEGLSNTLLESMASALPMIGSRVSGTEDFIEPSVNGWLFEPGDRAALVECLQAAHQLGHDRLAVMGEAARHRVQSTASIPAVTRQLLSLYDHGRLAISSNAASPPRTFQS
ncbi:MAG: glycosyltransferase family 4 protein [Lautropia sp.]|nr:glycosyltransferase family 4 protein [Lautropia sp.]